MLIGTDIGFIYNFDYKNYKIIDKYDESEENGRIISIKMYNDNFIICKNNSKIILKNLYNDFDTKELQINKENCSPVSLEIFKDKIFVALNDGTIMNKNLLNDNNFDLYKQLKCKKLNKLNKIDDNNYICLFKHINCSIYDLDKDKLKWASKNVKEDDIGLQRRINDLDSCYENNELFVSDTNSIIRLFDIRNNRRKSVMDKDFTKIVSSPISKLIVKGNYLYSSNNLGNIFVLDKRKNLSIIKKVTNSYGLITDLKFVDDYLCSIGLDRFIRFYDEELNLEREEFLNTKLRTITILDNNQKLEEKIDNSDSDELENLSEDNENSIIKFKDIKDTLNHNRIKLNYDKRAKN